MPQNSLGFVRSAANPGNPCAAPGKMPHLPYVLGLTDACGAPSQMNVLVTGATGAMGADLVPRLAAAGHRVRAFARDPARVTDPAVSEVVRGDAVAGTGLAAALAGIDTAYFLIHSMETSAADPLATGFADRDRRAAAQFAGAARAAGVRRVVYLGGLVPSGAGASRAPREPPRGRGDAARRRARGGRAAGVDRDRRAVAVVPLPRAPRRARAGHAPAGLARAPHGADRRARRDGLPRGGRGRIPSWTAGCRSTSRARRS